MLEPAVRPGLPVAGAAQQGRAPFESRGFQDLLREASQQTGEKSVGAGAAALDKSDPLGGLSGLGQIENAALRRMLTESRQTGDDAAA